MIHRLTPRSIARQVNRKRTLPQRMLRELRWAWRDIRDIRDELKRFAASTLTLTPQPRPKQSEMSHEDVARDGF